ncbi:MAG: ChuX/HutX family heme-like substrate-binding protein [Polynucleobacter sp.]|nr:ChuX/HutX family heme-like substrate-binding protein [Polynucleobacter sp.]
MHQTINSVRQSFSVLRKDEKLRHRDIAKKLGLSEGELIAAYVGIDAAPLDEGEMQVIRLRPEWPELLAAMESLGEVMALTRNAFCVHEKVGVYKNASKDGRIGLLVGEIDLRIFYHAWSHGFAVREMTPKGMQRSLQFFDQGGVAVHKIHLKPQSIVEKFDELVLRFKSNDQVPSVEVLAPDKPASELPDHDIDIQGWHQAWRDMKDTHDFFGLLRKFKLTRTQALRLAEPEFVEAIGADYIKDLLELAASSGLPIMVFVGNPGVIQIHSGPIKKVVSMGAWINVMDPRFNLHLRMDCIAKAWVVRKPTVDGIVTSVELFDADGEAIAMFFGERKPGRPERDAWRELIQELIITSSVAGV